MSISQPGTNSLSVELVLVQSESSEQYHSQSTARNEVHRQLKGRSCRLSLKSRDSSWGQEAVNHFSLA
jgi:hypothetical protein